MSDLKPCPFCGGEQIDVILDFHPICNNCGGSQDYIPGLDAKREWNARPLEDAKDARIAELEELARYCSGFLGCEDTRDSMALHSITIMAKELLAKGGE